MNKIRVTPPDSMSCCLPSPGPVQSNSNIMILNYSATRWGAGPTTRILLHKVIWELDYFFYSALCVCVCVYSSLKELSKVIKWMDSSKQQVPSETGISCVKSLIVSIHYVITEWDREFQSYRFLLEHSSTISRESERILNCLLSDQWI